MFVPVGWLGSSPGLAIEAVSSVRPAYSIGDNHIQMDHMVTRRANKEFVCLMAAMVSILALATDIMLPALDRIRDDLGVADENDVQLVVSTLFLGYALGQLLVGPLSDTVGRRPVIIAGYLIFMLGCLLSILASDLSVMLLGRALQGIGAAAPRIVTMAIIRDVHQGPEMARTLSLVLSIFIFVPAIAPSIGQVAIGIGGWRLTFALLLIIAMATLSWFAIRQPETIPLTARRPFSPRAIATGSLEAFGYRTTCAYTLATAAVLAAFVGYLSSAQQIFSDVFGIKGLFPVFFGLAALAMGAAFLINARLVMRYGMKTLVLHAAAGLALSAIMLLVTTLPFGGRPPLVLFLIWLAATKFCVGLLFGNLNALAMQPLGHMAGLGAALVGFTSTVVALPAGWLIGHLFAGTVYPLVAGFAVLAVAAYLAVTAVRGDPAK